MEMGMHVPETSPADFPKRTNPNRFRILSIKFIASCVLFVVYMMRWASAKMISPSFWDMWIVWMQNIFAVRSCFGRPDGFSLWRSALYTQTKKLWGELSKSFTRLCVKIVLAVVIYLVLYYIGSMVYHYVFSSTQHYFNPVKMEIAKFHTPEEMTHVVECQCDIVDLVEAREGYIYDKSHKFRFEISNIMRVHDEILKQTSGKNSFIVPKIWRSTDPRDHVLMSEIEFNPCIVSLRLDSRVLHIMNPNLYMSDPLAKHVMVNEPSDVFLYSPSIETARYTQIDVRGIDMYHIEKGAKLYNIKTPKTAVMVQHALDILSGKILEYIKEPILKEEDPEVERVNKQIPLLGEGVTRKVYIVSNGKDGEMPSYVIDKEKGIAKQVQIEREEL